MERSTELLRVLEDLGEEHDKTKSEIQLRLDALKAMKNAHTAFGRPLNDEDIGTIAQRAGVPYDVPAHYIGSPVPDWEDVSGNTDEGSDSELTDLSSTGL